MKMARGEETTHLHEDAQRDEGVPRVSQTTLMRDLVQITMCPAGSAESTDAMRWCFLQSTIMSATTFARGCRLTARRTPRTTIRNEIVGRIIKMDYAEGRIDAERR